MKYIEEIEFLLGEYKSLSIQRVSLGEDEIKIEKLKMRFATFLSIVFGICSYILLAVFYKKASVFNTVAVAFLIAPLAGAIFYLFIFPINKIRSLAFSTKNVEDTAKSVYLKSLKTAKNLDNKIIEHILRINVLVEERIRQRPVRYKRIIRELKFHYIQSQHSKITEIITLLNQIDETFYKRKHHNFTIQEELFALNIKVIKMNSLGYTARST